MHGHRPPTPSSSLGPLCRIDGTTFWLVGIFAANLTLNTVFVNCTQRTPLHLPQVLRNLWQISGLWLTRFCISPQVALRDEILWQPDRGPDPTTSRFETESATTEPQKLAEFMFSFCLIDCHKCADTFLNAAIYSINFSTLKSGRLYLTS